MIKLKIVRWIKIIFSGNNRPSKSSVVIFIEAIFLLVSSSPIPLGLQYTNTLRLSYRVLQCLLFPLNGFLTIVSLNCFIAWVFYRTSCLKYFTEINISISKIRYVLSWCSPSWISTFFYYSHSIKVLCNSILKLMLVIFFSLFLGAYSYLQLNGYLSMMSLTLLPSFKFESFSILFKAKVIFYPYETFSFY